jgi:predicted DNA-binding ribbon-helix-helix protein
MNTLSNRNVTVNGRRTSMRLEQEMWDALSEICRREDMTVHELCSLIDDRRGLSSLTAATRVFILMYYRAAATDEGHATAGHGKQVPRHLKDRLGIDLGGATSN